MLILCTSKIDLLSTQAMSQATVALGGVLGSADFYATAVDVHSSAAHLIDEFQEVADTAIAYSADAEKLSGCYCFIRMMLPSNVSWSDRISTRSAHSAA